MALREIKCPHCEQDVEVDVSSTTSSCGCPNCGESIVLQFTSNPKRARRTALVVPAVDAVEKLRQAPHADHALPRALEGDAHDRLMHDPEVRQNLRRLKWGAGILVGFIVLLSVADYFGWWSAIGSHPKAPAAPGPAPQPPTLAAKPKPQEATQPDVREVLTRFPAPPMGPPPATAPKSEVQKPAAAPPVLVTPKPPGSEEEPAIETVRAFLDAKDVEERLKYVRDVNRMEPVIRAYYASHPAGPILHSGITAVPGASRTDLLRKFQVQLPDGRQRLATVGRAGSGDYRVDWASLVIYSAMDWEEFRRQRPTQPVFMRVLMEPGSRYDGNFADVGRYLCVKFTDPLNPDSKPIHGYVERQSSVGKALNLILHTYPGNPVAAMVTLKQPPQDQSITTDSGQVLVDKLIGEGWLTSGT